MRVVVFNDSSSICYVSSVRYCGGYHQVSGCIDEGG